MLHSPRTIQPTQVMWDEVPIVAYQLTSQNEKRRPHRIILFHGLAGSAAQWFDTLSILATAGYTSIAFDLPGHGQSGLPEANALTPDWMGKALAVWLQTQPTLPTILVGHSLGGWVVLRAYLHNPQAVAGMVLVASSGLQGIPWQPRQLKFSTGFAQWTQQILNSMFYNPKRVKPQILQALLGEAIASPALTTLRPEGLLALEELYQIHCPVQVIWGEQDRIIPVEWARVFAHYLPRSTLTLLPECGHFPHLEVPTLFHQYLTQFLLNFMLV